MENFFVQNGLIFKPAKEVPITGKLEKLPVALYDLKSSMTMGFYLERNSDSFDNVDKCYGDVESISAKILNAHNKIDSSLGALFVGEKGTGKTHQAKHIANTSQLPIININTNFKGSDFFSFLEDIKQKCIIFIDEFEKKYPDQESQEQMLPLLDGGYKTKHLYVFTSNSFNSITTYVKSRPSRIRYLKEYSGIDSKVLEGYCKDNLKYSHYYSKILDMSSRLGYMMSFDILKCVVEELNMSNGEENFNEVIEMMNIDKSDTRLYQISSVTFKDDPSRKIKHDEWKTYTKPRDEDDDFTVYKSLSNTEGRVITSDEKYLNLEITDVRMEDDFLIIDGIEMIDTYKLARENPDGKISDLPETRVEVKMNIYKGFHR